MIAKVSILIIPLHGIFYLNSYYEEFGITYFMYFNPVDFLTIFYDKYSKIFFLIIAFLIPITVYVSSIFNIKHTKFYLNSTICGIFILYLIILMFLSCYYDLTSDALTISYFLYRFLFMSLYSKRLSTMFISSIAFLCDHYYA